MVLQKGEVFGGGMVMCNLTDHVRFEPNLEELGQYYKQGHWENVNKGESPRLWIIGHVF